jgi:hypothetical protein
VADIDQSLGELVDAVIAFLSIHSDTHLVLNEVVEVVTMNSTPLVQTLIC